MKRLELGRRGVPLQPAERIHRSVQGAGEVGVCIPINGKVASWSQLHAVFAGSRSNMGIDERGFMQLLFCRWVHTLRALTRVSQPWVGEALRYTGKANTFRANLEGRGVAPEDRGGPHDLGKSIL